MKSLDIIDILMCPECKIGLSEDLKCKGCHNQYSLKNRIFNIVSQKLSGTLLQKQKEISEFLVIRNTDRVPISEEYQKAWRQAHQKVNDCMNPLLDSLSGTVCDLATGIGSHLKRLLNVESKDFNIVCIDIERTVLRLAATENNPRVFCVTADARYMSIKDDSFDYITSHGVFDNVAESDKVANEMYRTLKQHGKLIIRGEYIEKDSKSYELAQSMKLDRGMIEENLILELEKAGFKNIVSTIVAKIRAERQEGILPPAVGDMIYFYVVQAEKC